jgi:hypothetical protein
LIVAADSHGRAETANCGGIQYVTGVESDAAGRTASVCRRCGKRGGVLDKR